MIASSFKQLTPPTTISGFHLMVLRRTQLISHTSELEYRRLRRSTRINLWPTTSSDPLLNSAAGYSLGSRFARKQPPWRPESMLPLYGLEEERQGVWPHAAF